MSPFVGRGNELRHLDEALTLAAEGLGSMILLAGEPGIGKTRLAQESVALASRRGFRVLEGRAYPVETGLAYAPFIDAFRPLLRSFDSTRLASLVSGLPDLGRLFSDLPLPPPSFPERLGDPALEKTRLFEAMLRLVERLARETPVAFFLDDMQWADPATLELLHHLVRGLADQPVLLLATIGAHSLDTSLGLQALVVSLERDGMAEQMVVPRLEPEVVDKLVRGILEGEPPGDLLAILDARAGGRPLFVEALIGSLIDSGNLVFGDDGWKLDAEGATTLPPTVRRLILDRLGRLMPADRQVLDLLAALGDGASHTILRTASGMEEQALLQALRHLRAAGLVAEGMDGSDVAYSITHPLVQEVIYAELTEMERRQAHLAAIEAIESFSERRPDDINRLAHHYLGAGREADNDRALTVLMAAGDRALSLYANEEAAQHYAAALAVVRQGGGLRGEGREPFTLNPSPSTLPQLLERLGEAWERIGKRGAAVEVWNEALVLLSEGREREGHFEAVSRLRRQLASAECYRGHFDIGEAHLEAGLAALQGRTGRETSRELIDIHSVRFQICHRRGDVEGMANTATEILSLAARLASPRAEAEANFVASISSLLANDVASARERALHALEIAEQAQEMATSCRLYGWLVDIGMRLGDHQFMHCYAERGLAQVQRLGVPSLEVILRSRLAYANFMSGAWDGSLRCTSEAIALARRVGHPRDLANSLAAKAMILALQGNPSEAETCISEVRAVFGNPSQEGLVDRYVRGLVDIAEVCLSLDRGDVESALEIARGFVGPETSSTAPFGLAPPFLPIGLALLAEAQLAAGDANSVLKTARNIAGLGPTSNPYLIALASLAEGLARQRLGQQEMAIDCLTRAHENFITLEMPFEAARSLLEQAEIRGQGSGDVGRGPGDGLLPPAQAAEQSLATFERLGARRYAERARILLAELGISPRAPQQNRLGGVTVSPRELEIARLIAAGLTSDEIAKRLVLSPRTVDSHLRRIYTRLGINSRTALARLVFEAGLL